MAIIPSVDTTLRRINTIQLPEKEDLLKFLSELEKIIEEKSEESEKPRGYLGMSGIGDPCKRKLWYGFHMATKKEPIEERTKRIFNTGHIAEGLIVKDLQKIGIKISNQQAECVGVAGHFMGHIDGEAEGVIEAPKTPHLTEFKTHNDKSFKALAKAGSVHKAKPIHYAQQQVYMYYRKLTRSLYVSYNKNTSEYYIERVYFDKEYAEGLINKATEIIMSEHPPEKEFSKTWHECKWCNHYDVCHNGDMPDKNCRTCKESDICDDGKWECSIEGKELNIDEQIRGCELHKWGWGLDE